MSEEKFLRATMHDGSEWTIPIESIADHKAKYRATDIKGCAIKWGDESLKREWFETYKAEYYRIIKDDSELLDWANYDMNWEDVQHLATKTKPPKEIDLERAWSLCEKEIITKQKE